MNLVWHAYYVGFINDNNFTNIILQTDILLDTLLDPPLAQSQNSLAKGIPP